VLVGDYSQKNDNIIYNKNIIIKDPNNVVNVIILVANETEQNERDEPQTKQRAEHVDQ